MPDVDLQHEVDDFVEEQTDDTPLEQPAPEKKSLFVLHPRARWIVLAIAVVLLIGAVAAWMYYRVRWKQPLTFTMVDVSDKPFADCTAPDTRADEVSNLITGQLR